MLPQRQFSPEGQVSGVCIQAESSLHIRLVCRRISWDSCGRPGCAPHDPAGLSRMLTPTQSTFLLYSQSLSHADHAYTQYHYPLCTYTYTLVHNYLTLTYLIYSRQSQSQIHQHVLCIVLLCTGPYENINTPSPDSQVYTHHTSTHNLSTHPFPPDYHQNEPSTAVKTSALPARLRRDRRGEKNRE